MFIHRLTAFEVPVALRSEVRHASHTRTENSTLLVRCVMNDGSVGWGEGLPRAYVTGETIETAWQHLTRTNFACFREQQFCSALELARSIDTFSLHPIEWAHENPPRECFGNAARCALELAVLDAACRCEGISVGKLIHALPESRGLASSRDNVYYSGVITSLSTRRQLISALKMRLFAFRQVKIKVGTPGISDRDCVARVRRIVGPRVDLRLDANEAWSCDEVANRLAPLIPFRPSSIEQPVAHRNISGLSQVRKEVSIPIMLDESLCCEQDAFRAIQGGWCDAFNIRLSKCGGLVRSIRLAAIAQSAGLKFQLGCQVGETGILSAAGRHFACNLSGLQFLEGSYDRFLVRDRLTTQDVTFLYRGRGPRITGPGLGVDVDECRIRELVVRQKDLIAPPNHH